MDVSLISKKSAMFQNYFRIALRNLIRNRLSSAINIGGLVIGMSVAILIGLWVFDELSFDRFPTMTALRQCCKTR